MRGCWAGHVEDNFQYQTAHPLDMLMSPSASRTGLHVDKTEVHFPTHLDELCVQGDHAT